VVWVAVAVSGGGGGIAEVLSFVVASAVGAGAAAFWGPPEDTTQIPIPTASRPAAPMPTQSPVLDLFANAGSSRSTDTARVRAAGGGCGIPNGIGAGGRLETGGAGGGPDRGAGSPTGTGATGATATAARGGAIPIMVVEPALAAGILGADGVRAGAMSCAVMLRSMTTEFSGSWDCACGGWG
jgi:hypothetical protein